MKRKIGLFNIFVLITSLLMPSILKCKTAVLVIASRGYQPTEYGVTKDILEKNGITVVTVSNKAGTARADDGSSTTVDKTLDNLTLEDFDGIFFIGGSGALLHLNKPISHSLLQEAVKNNKIIGAICISPRILAQAGVLVRKHATGWDGDGQLSKVFNAYGAIHTKKEVVVDGNIVTATDPTAATGFGNAIVKLLKKST